MPINLKQLGERYDGAIKSFFPSWDRARSRARLESAQAKYLQAGYDAAQQRTQRSDMRQGQMLAEYGACSDTDLSTMIAWSRETWRNNSIMSSLARRACDNVVGSGLALRPVTDGGAELNEDLALAFKEHTSRGGGWEVTNRYSMAQGQRLAFLSVLRDADFLMYRSDDGWQFFEGGQIGTPIGYDRAKARIIQGAQLDARGGVAYWWVAEYSKYGYVDPTHAKGLRADKCCHVVNPEFFSSYRGIPIWASCLGRFDDVEKYLETEILGAMAAACIVGEIQSNKTNPLDAFNINKQKDGAGKSDEKHNRHQMAPGMMLRTYIGEQFKLHSAQRPGAPVPEFLRLCLRFLGMPVGMPLELGLMDYTSTNFAAAKMAVNQAALTQLFHREVCITDQMVKPIYLDWARTQKAVKVPASVKRPFAFEVIPPKTEWLETFKEAQALNAGLEGGWDTLTRICKEEMNRTVRDVMIENADEIVMAKEIATQKGIPDEWREVRRKLVAEKAEKIANGEEPNSPGEE